MDMNQRKTKYNKKIIAVLLLGCVVIAGCMGCGKKTVSVEDGKKTVVMKLNDYEVTLSEYNLFAIQYMMMQGMNPDDITSDKIDSMKTEIASEIKLEIVEYLLAQQTDGVEVSDDAKAEITTNTDNYIDKLGEDFLSQYGIDKDAVTQLFTEQAYIQALTDKAKQDLADDAYKDNAEKFKDTDFHTVYYALFPSIQYDKDGNAVTDDNGESVSLSEDELKKQKQKAEELQKRAAKGEKLEDLIEEYGISAYSGEERNYQGAYEDKLNQVVDNMEKGDISDVVETDAGYMVVRMDNPKDDDYKEYALHYAAMQTANSMITTLQQNWVAASGCKDVEPDEDAIKSVDFKGMCQKMKDNGVY